MEKSVTMPGGGTTSDQIDLHYHDCAIQGNRYATTMLRNSSDAEEAVQESFYRMHKSDPSLDASDYRKKFFVVLKNHCIDRIRNRNVRKEVTVGSEIESIDSPANVNSEPSSEAMKVIEAELNALPENYRQALLLKIHGLLSYDEIAAVTESTHSQVRTWIYRGRRQLENALQLRGILEQTN